MSPQQPLAPKPRFPTPPRRRPSCANSALEYHEFPTPGKIAVTAAKQLINQHDLASPTRPAWLRRAKNRQGPNNAFKYTSRGNLGGRGHQRHGRAGPGRYRSAGIQAGHGRQGCAVQEVRRHRRVRHRNRRETTSTGWSTSSAALEPLRRHQPGGHQGAGLLLCRAQAARAHEDSGLPRRPARHGHRRRRGHSERPQGRGQESTEVKLVTSGAGAAPWPAWGCW